MKVSTLDSVMLIFQQAFFALRYLIFILLHKILPKVFIEYPLNAPTKSNAVLITGASSGIGKHASLYLAERGFTVFAGIRKAEDGKSLTGEFASMKKASGVLVPLMVDVASEKSIKDSVDFVEKYLKANGTRLVGVVNNAGIGCPGPLEVFSDAEMLNIWNVNVNGIVRMIRHYLPVLRERGAGARVVNIGSVGGMTTLPSNGIYCATKYAVQALSDSLRGELRDQNISVSCVNPGAIKTKIFGKQLVAKTNVADQMSAKTKEVKQKYYQKFEDRENNALSAMDKLAADPIYTSVAIEHALTSKFPQAKYLPGLDAPLIIFLANVLPTPVFDALSAFVLDKGVKVIAKKSQ